MTYTIAIQPDRGRLPDGTYEWFDPWTEAIQAAGHVVRPVDLRGPDPIGQLAGCDALMWRFLHVLGDYILARRILPVVERHLKLAVFPDQDTCWHYDDKIAQAYLFKALGIPTPRTWVFWRLADALEFCAQAEFPLVAKLSRGASSLNVQLVRSRDEAERLVCRLFSRGIRQFDIPERATWGERVQNAVRWIVRGREPVPRHTWDLHKNYAYFQEFLPGNAYDTRIVVIGGRAFGFRRFNREGDFRASGSGRIDHDPAQIDPRFVRLALRIARDLRMQSCAIDGLYRDGEPCVGEISYTHPSPNVVLCPGHWRVDGDVETGELRWQQGSMRPQDAIVSVVLESLRQRTSQCVASGSGALPVDDAGVSCAIGHD